MSDKIIPTPDEQKKIQKLNNQIRPADGGNTSVSTPTEDEGEESQGICGGGCANPT